MILARLERLGAIIKDSHIVYTSGKHGSAYINKDAIYPDTGEVSHLCRVMAEKFVYDCVDVVAAPAIGGVILSQWTAHHLSQMTGREVLSVYAEKTADDAFTFRRGYDRLLPDRNVLVVEDVMTTGTSARKVVDAVRALRGNVIGLGVLCNRGNVASQDVASPPKMVALVNVSFDAWNEAECPLCTKGIPINTDVGKGREYLAAREGQ